jgi:hypothetical protein
MCWSQTLGQGKTTCGRREAHEGDQMAVARGSARLGARRVGCSEVLGEADALVVEMGTVEMDKVG